MAADDTFIERAIVEITRSVDDPGLTKKWTEAERVRKEAERKAKLEREALAEKHAEEMRLASMVTCPHCGKQFSTEDVA